MERRMEPRTRTRDGTGAEGVNGYAGRFLPAIEQFRTRACARCAGLLVNEWCHDLPSTGGYTTEVLRCVQCGHRVDPVIVQNQIRPKVASALVQPARPKNSMSMDLQSA